MHSFFISYYGELETILPWLYVNDETNKYKKINIIISSQGVFERLKKDIVFTSIFKKFNVEITVSSKSNIIIQVLKSKYIYVSDLDLTLQKFIYFFAKFLQKKIIIFKHTSTPYSNFKSNLMSVRKIKSFQIFSINYNVKRLVHEQREKDNYISIGFKNVEVTGNPLANIKYQKFLQGFKFKHRNYILIFSYGISEALFKKNARMNHYRILFKNIKKYFKNKKIIIKPHPQESLKIIKKILIRNTQVKNVIISEENSGLLAKHADLSVGLVAAGACFQSYQQNKPSINYYLDYLSFYKLNNFRWPKCIVRETISTAHNKPALQNFFLRYRNYKYSGKKIYY